MKNFKNTAFQGLTDIMKDLEPQLKRLTDLRENNLSQVEEMINGLEDEEKKKELRQHLNAVKSIDIKNPGSMGEIMGMIEKLNALKDAC